MIYYGLIMEAAWSKRRDILSFDKTALFSPIELYHESMQNVVSDYFLRMSDGKTLQKILLVGHDSLRVSPNLTEFDNLQTLLMNCILQSETACLGGEKGTFIV